MNTISQSVNNFTSLNDMLSFIIGRERKFENFK